MNGPLPTYVPFLEEHWRRNSLYGLLEAAGRFNLCTAWEISRLVDGWAEMAFEFRPLPLVANLPAFISWSATCDVESIAPEYQALRLIVEAAQRDAREVGLGWLVPWLKWCPICADAQMHRAIHQHKATAYCPEHGARLVTQCAYCAASSPYRVQRRSGLFQCAHCGQSVCGANGTFAALFHHHARKDVASTELDNARQRAESVIIPGLPCCRQIVPAHTHRESMAHDLRILHGEQILEPQLRSVSSKILGHYFRFAGQQLESKALRPSREDYDRGVLSVLQQVRTLALLTGHTCVLDSATHNSADHRDCPCGIGFRVWKQRLSFDGFRISCARFEGVQADVYEASHLGLCLSMAWFSSVQANCARDAAIYESLIGFLDSRVDDFGSDDQRVGVSTLAYRFQWFTIPCVHDSQRFLRRLGQFESARRALQSGMASIWDEISWLTS